MDFKDIIRLWPDESCLLADMAEYGLIRRRGTANKWSERNMIRAEYYHLLIAAALKRNLTVNGEPLALHHLVTAAAISARERQAGRERPKERCE